MKQDERLMTSRRFAPMFFTQFFGALNDNVFKQALLLVITYGWIQQQSAPVSTLNNLAALLFILPYFFFSATAGQLADKYERSQLIRFIKILEIVIMLIGTAGFLLGNLWLLLFALFLMGTHSTCFGPIKYAILPEILKQEELMSGNALFQSGTSIAILLGMILGGAVIAYNLFDHVQTRVEIWLNPWDQYTERGYQPIQALFALANGGMTGTGLGIGDPGAIPAAHNDFIFAALGEELGLLGGVAILSAFVLLVGAGMRTALRAQRDFEKLLATGLTTIVAIQTFIIIGGVLRVVPLTGVTLPFMSYGGSSLVANYVVLALLIRISDTTARSLHEVPDDSSIAERFALWRLRRAAAA